MEKNNPKTLNAWVIYDWANSVYNLVITTAIFPVYYANATKKAFGGSLVEFFGIQIDQDVLYSYAISFSFFVIMFASPVLSGIADYGGKKKMFMRMFTYLGSSACMGLFFFEGQNIEWGILMAILASIGYAGALVFYNAFLPEIATEDRFDVLSARGYSLGYIGSVVLLVFNLIMMSKPEAFGLENGGQAAKISFLTVGLWWIGFAQITFYFLPNKTAVRSNESQIWKKGFQEIQKVFANLKNLPTLRKFLLSFFFYNLGVQTVMLLAPTFGKSEINVPDNMLLGVVVIIQLVAVAGAFLFAFLSKKYGNKLSISVMLVIWVLVCIAAYLIQTPMQFNVLAVVIGLIMGGIQSLSRSTYSKLLPENTADTASFFSFYDVIEKMSIVLGTFSFGFIKALTGSMRNSALFLGFFFLLGLLVLSQIRIQRDETTQK